MRMTMPFVGACVMALGLLVPTARACGHHEKCGCKEQKSACGCHEHKSACREHHAGRETGAALGRRTNVVFASFRWILPHRHRHHDRDDVAMTPCGCTGHAMYTPAASISEPTEPSYSPPAPIPPAPVAPMPARPPIDEDGRNLD